MRELVRVSSLLLLGLAGAAQALQPVILADTNRDGHIDLVGDTDSVDKETWTDKRGALFLANIADSGRRCSRLIVFAGENATRTEDLDKCHDASDNVLRNPKYLAPVATLPLTGAGDSASGSVAVIGDAASKNIRLFQRAGSDWRFIAANHTFSAEELRSGLSLGVDARDVRRPGGWDGRVTLRFSVRDGADSAEDSVALRVAPILIHHHLQDATELIVATLMKKGPQEDFIAELGRRAKEAGIEAPVRLVRGETVFTQDEFEAGYMSIPGPSGPVTLRVAIRPSKLEMQDYIAFDQLRSDTVGAVQHLPSQKDEDTGKDATGNLETIPPYEHQGKAYPAGRTIMGSRYGKKANMVEFLEAQGAQPNVEVDTSWLYVGHVDEFMQFLPAPSDRGWVMAVHDPLQGLEILRKAQRDGHGADKALSRPPFPNDMLGTHAGPPPLPNTTVDGVLALPLFARVQEYVARQIEKNVEVVRRETGLVDAEILRIPGLFYNETMTGKRDYQLYGVDLPDEKDEEASLGAYETAYQVYSMYPSTVNGIALTSKHYLAPNPWGPSVDGKDVLLEATAEAYAASNMTVTFVDDYYSHHLGVGEIHCGSNAFREYTPRWW
ncbi:Protein-arginine deiminase [Cordyceps fumosorosea ARSEF 2679]|uniref:Protein-arginine deiminase n=1 Tax=Cordyceps fumosorosea (strain ARSEF 2679) TaxID=1081104 RepID=A0A167V4L9_CORFA|nr:Protein-arginine deiminase [Cordyceps fumosorosea ARSEF 2679]OAA62220.1 Protein-arginine deiminase [Cordyceps fumosorosea ARSEF 2679]